MVTRFKLNSDFKVKYDESSEFIFVPSVYEENKHGPDYSFFKNMFTTQKFCDIINS